MAKIGKLTALESKREDRQKTKEKYPKILKIRKIPQEFPRRNVIDAANRHIKEKKVRPLTSLAGNDASECKSQVVLSVDDERQDENSDEDYYFLGEVEEFQTK